MPAPINALDAALPGAAIGPAMAPFDAWCRQALTPLASASRPSRSDVGAPGFDAAVLAQADLLEVQFADGSVYYTAPQAFAALHPDPALARAAEVVPDRATSSAATAPAASMS